MTWLQVIGALIQLIAPIIKSWFEKNSAKKQSQDKAIQVVLEGIKNGDASAVTAGFDALNRRVR